MPEQLIVRVLTSRASSGRAGRAMRKYRQSGDVRMASTEVYTQQLGERAPNQQPFKEQPGGRNAKKHDHALMC